MGRLKQSKISFEDLSFKKFYKFLLACFFSRKYWPKTDCFEGLFFQFLDKLVLIIAFILKTFWGSLGLGYFWLHEINYTYIAILYFITRKSFCFFLAIWQFWEEKMDSKIKATENNRIVRKN